LNLKHNQKNLLNPEPIREHKKSQDSSTPSSNEPTPYIKKILQQKKRNTKFLKRGSGEEVKPEKMDHSLQSKEALSMTDIPNILFLPKLLKKKNKGRLSITSQEI